MPRRSRVLDFIGKVLLGFALLFCGVAYGIIAHSNQIFPMPTLNAATAATKGVLNIFNDYSGWYYSHFTPPVPKIAANAEVAGLTLVTGLAANRELAATVIDAHGREIHRWTINWFKLWPDPDHVPIDDRPNRLPGEVIHGALLLNDGDLVFNFDHLGLIRLDACGNVVWRLPYRTHHSLEQDNDGNFWVSGQITRTSSVPEFPNYRPPFDEPTIVKVSPDGKVLREISVFDLLIANGRRALMYMASTDNWSTEVSGDTLHLNDVEIFPARLPAGVFKPGDVMISLRNINTILVFDPRTLHIKFISTGQVLRQHDPDFVDGNTISVFDNNNLAPDGDPPSSRIVTISAIDGQRHVRFAGSPRLPFFTDIMGKQQLLPDGHILITEARLGHAFEIDRHNAVVWEYYNRVADGVVGAITEAQRLPAQYDAAFFARARARCAASS